MKQWNDEIKAKTDPPLKTVCIPGIDEFKIITYKDILDTGTGLRLRYSKLIHFRCGDCFVPVPEEYPLF